MIEIKGGVATAICYAKVIEDEAIEQIRRMCDYDFTEGSKVCIMPDVHSGAGCTIGTTMTVNGKAVPNVVGVDIGCGMYTVKLKERDIDFARLDEACHFVPSGKNVWDGRKEDFDFSRLVCFRELKEMRWLKRSLGTLGGGNHFIEVDEAGDGTKYLVIHSGSRNLGKQVAELYQRLAIDLNRAKDATLPDDLCYVYGNYLDDYLHDVDVCQQFAKRNRELMAEIITERAGLTPESSFHTIHNYIDVDEMILRKGAIAAHEGEQVLIPINMRDGSVLARGKGNPEWNFSAPPRSRQDNVQDCSKKQPGP